MTTYVFRGQKATLKTTFTCACCGRPRRSKTITVEHTVNPFNRDENGQVKDARRVYADARAAAGKQMDAFKRHPLCSSCEPNRSAGADSEYQRVKALRNSPVAAEAPK